MSFLSSLLFIMAIFVGIAGAAVYFVGLPEAWKQQIAEKAAVNMGESAATDLVRGK